MPRPATNMSTNETNADPQAPNFQFVEDVKVTLRAELDQRTISFPALLGLEVGSILQLTRPTGENVDLYAGDVLIGCGEILIIDSNLAVRKRLTALPADRRILRAYDTSFFRAVPGALDGRVQPRGGDADEPTARGCARARRAAGAMGAKGGRLAVVEASGGAWGRFRSLDWR